MQLRRLHEKKRSEERMKKFLIITVLMMFSLTVVFAQAEKIEIKMEKFEGKMEKFAEEMEKLAEKLADEDSPVIIRINDNAKASSVHLGVFPKDLTLENVRDLNYDLNYGVLISGVVAGSSASRQKIFVNDIIYEIDGRKVTNNRAFTEILKSYNPGDVAQFKMFSAGKHIDKSFAFEGKAKTQEDVTLDLSKKKKEVDWNSIAINWIPRYYQFDDIDDVNGILTDQMQFSEIDDKGLFMNGFGFRIHAGGGFYIGGEWSWYEDDKKINIQTNDPSNFPGNSPIDHSQKSRANVTREMKYSNGFGGITLDKRIYFTKYFQPGIGFLLGAGTQRLELSQTNGDYDWTDLNNDFNSSENNYMVMNRDYVIFQPRADLYIPILSWVGVRAEAGYVMGYTPYKGWKGGDYDYGINNSPDTKCTGLTFSVGPWIEF